jgi:hypothetical protein
MSYDADEILARRAFVRRVRDRLRDYPDLNTLMEGEEHYDIHIERRVEETLADFNAVPPLIGNYDVANFPNIDILLDGVMARLLESSALLYLRNDLDFVAGSVTVRLPQPQTYLAVANQKRASYQQRARELKVALNKEMAVDASVIMTSDFSRMYSPHTHLIE